MKLSHSILAVLFVISSQLTHAAQTFCGLSLTAAWPEVVTETTKYFTKYISAKENERKDLEREFEKIASGSIKKASEEDQQAIDRWVSEVKQMLEYRGDPELVHALTLAAIRTFGDWNQRIKADLKNTDPHVALELGLSLDERLEVILQNSKNSDLKNAIARWREDYPETLGVFLVSHLLQLEVDQEANLSKFSTKIKDSISKLMNAAGKILKRKNNQAISDARFEKLLKVGPKVEKRLRFITAIQVGLVTGSAVTFVALDDVAQWNSLFLQVFGPYLGMKMSEWAYAGQTSDVKKKSQNRWAIWSAVVAAQTFAFFAPGAQWISNFIMGPGGGGVFFGRVLGGRAYSVSPENAADAIVESQLFERLTQTQLTQLITRVSEAKKSTVQKQLDALSLVK